MVSSMPPLRGLLPEEIGSYIQQWGHKPYRGKQIFTWIQSQAVQRADEMTDLPKGLRQEIEERKLLQPLRRKAKQISRDGTEKYLWELGDGECIETVCMPYERRQSRQRVTLCLSTQVGCPLGCKFCATGQQGFTRNLTAAEILGQVLDITYEKRLEKQDFKVTNIVFMGMGEPMLNYDEVKKAIALLTHPQGQAIGQRRITVSTAGVVPGIERFAEEGWEVNLALSLHTIDPALRSTWMPVNDRYPLKEVLEACKRYWEKTRRRLSVEYALIAGVNDSLEDAQKLAKTFHQWPVHLNIIPVNPVQSSGALRPAKESLQKFTQELQRRGLEAVVREERGTDIDAACGQLRSQKQNKKEG
ncbi:23S rRNA (adenine(2503)-C(2))-methyltransferase RlmN [Heliorestis convoluta]|uniref:Probable dual-specificity RNA methyltransferase RlmN n=1 Tax=Heliorestis convoluta TaxID=356322 RepID=A0A5Q2N3V2_9FIRM|nr:23S rRNA (adenine(2503)-C(2))-methyltransferase RlmN [Heliorestis convoluta]QGG47982.1 23S rRNA (adenine(2503)-C(2))-methyltransferase [Heliorestis convoluta]